MLLVLKNLSTNEGNTSGGESPTFFEQTCSVPNSEVLGSGVVGKDQGLVPRTSEGNVVGKEFKDADFGGKLWHFLHQFE